MQHHSTMYFKEKDTSYNIDFKKLGIELIKKAFSFVSSSMQTAVFVLRNLFLAKCKNVFDN